jgi:endonuclease VIII
MPEGDTIWRTAAALRRRLDGQVVRAARPAASLGRLGGRRVVGVEPVGKHLFIRFDGGLALHTHMRMEGSWHLYAPGERWRRPEHMARAVLETDDTVAVCFLAPLVELVADDRGSVRHLGPDILDPEFDVDDAVERARRSGCDTVGEVLLDQRVCAGIGNIHKCNALWQCRVDPWAPLDAVADATLRTVLLTARDRMRRSAVQRGFARQPGVHGRGGRPCPRCSTLVSVRSQGTLGRPTYWCTRCQGPGRTTPLVATHKTP